MRATFQKQKLSVLSAGLVSALSFVSGPSAWAQSAAQSANQAASSDNGSQTASMVMAGSMVAVCNKPPGNYAPCILAALAAAQAAAAGSASSGASDNASQLSTGTSTTQVSQNAASGAGNSATASVAAIKTALATAGAPMSADGKNITLPDGTSVPLTGASASDAGMAAAGLSQKQIDEGHQALADAKAKAAGIKTAAVTGEMGGGGGSSSSSSGYTPSSPSAKTPKGVSRSKPTLSGLTKNLGNDKIGVSADDIFDMVSRRYQSRDSKGTFLK